MADSDGESLSGAKGEKLKNTVWHEIVEALKKDVPEVEKLIGI